MIEVNISTTDITVDGHVGYAETEKDIICAAVSVLTQGLVHSLKALTNDENSFPIVVSDIQNAYGNFIRGFIYPKFNANSVSSSTASGTTLELNGKYDATTSAAVKVLQKLYGLTADGEFGKGKNSEKIIQGVVGSRQTLFEKNIDFNTLLL